MVAACKRIVESIVFQFFILFVIVAAAVLVGVETYESISLRHHETLLLLNRIVLTIFVIEAALKMLQYGKEFCWR